MPEKSFANAASALAITIVLTGCFASNGEEKIEKEPQIMSSPATEEVMGTIKREPPALTFFFNINEDDLGSEHDQHLWDVADYLVKSGDTFEIIGCSSTDKSKDNFALSYRRMGAVRDALMERYVPQEQFMDLYGNGENCTPLSKEFGNTPDQVRRASIVLNPTYDQPHEHGQQNNPDSDNGNMFQFLNLWSEEPDPAP
ncbi:MAG: hypothetical protein COB14_01620 [Alphaproteobacteria bacterium]|nr:MAG: hypothetical protein COB14_01620 [Alphaproteobacteria bacterium]